jgi:hypothetical protein
MFIYKLKWFFLNVYIKINMFSINLFSVVRTLYHTVYHDNAM